MVIVFAAFARVAIAGAPSPPFDGTAFSGGALSPALVSFGAFGAEPGVVSGLLLLSTTVDGGGGVGTEPCCANTSVAVSDINNAIEIAGRSIAFLISCCPAVNIVIKFSSSAIWGATPNFCCDASQSRIGFLCAL